MLSSFIGLESLPIEIRDKSCQEIIDYILDLYRTIKPTPLFRTKLMVVGYSGIGKTTLLDCLLPLNGYLTSGNEKFWYHLQGKYLYKYKNENDKTSLEDIVFENQQWEIEKMTDKNGDYGFILKKIVVPIKTIELICPNEENRELWFEKLGRQIHHLSTRGIDIRRQELNYPIIKQLFKDFRKNEGIQLDIENEKLEMSVWDFAGQNEYYNSHHYFLSARSVFIIGWKISDGDLGIEGLKFWLQVLKTHLSSSNIDAQSGKPLFSIIIVGTHLDHREVREELRPKREQKIRELLENLEIDISIKIFEVSCSSLKNIDSLQKEIFEETFSHSYMGEIVPEDYLLIEKAISELRIKYQDLPLIELTELQRFIETDLKRSIEMQVMKRGLSLLSAWGECIYFDKPIELSTLVVLDPKFLSKEIFVGLFNPEMASNYENGIIPHSDLKYIWSSYSKREDFNRLAEKLLLLMEKFEVCFQLYEDEDDFIPNFKEDRDETSETREFDPTAISTTTTKKGSKVRKESDFFSRKSVFPLLLPENPQEEISSWWPIECPDGKIELERVFGFNVTPQEMIGRLFVRIHKVIDEKHLWKNGMYFDKGQIQSLLKVDIEKNQLSIEIRGTMRSSCIKLMNSLENEILVSVENYQGVSMNQYVRSPHFSEALLTIEEINEDAKRKKTERKLICPKTKKPIEVEYMLKRAGLMDEVQSPLSSLFFFSKFFFSFFFLFFSLFFLSFFFENL